MYRYPVIFYCIKMIICIICKLWLTVILSITNQVISKYNANQIRQLNMETIISYIRLLCFLQFYPLPTAPPIPMPPPFPPDYPPLPEEEMELSSEEESEYESGDDEDKERWGNHGIYSQRALLEDTGMGFCFFCIIMPPPLEPWGLWISQNVSRNIHGL